MGWPPLAISILFCGRNRATTALCHGQYLCACCLYSLSRGAPLIVLEPLCGHLLAVSRRSRVRRGYLRHGCCSVQCSGPGAALCLLRSLSAAVLLLRTGECCCPGTVTSLGTAPGCW
jgi:hypothetical protein